MVLKTLYSTKKTFFYKFFPTKEEEECLKARKFGGGGRVMVEIRDVFPPPVVDPDNPWRINKTLNCYEIDSGKLVLSRNDTFEHVLRYWSIGLANNIALGLRVNVAMWDVTQENYPRKYESNDACLQMVGNDDFVLVCMALMKDRDMKDRYRPYSIPYWNSRMGSSLMRLRSCRKVTPKASGRARATRRQLSVSDGRRKDEKGTIDDNASDVHVALVVIFSIFLFLYFSKNFNSIL
ncbi:hypothetical protein Pfo_021712 [Paulownia fortunei]|nr:hypothetical protein Pfo_021712 [Paulownia fortunei]